MHILYIVSTLEQTGPINQLYNNIKYLNRGQFIPKILTLSPEPKSSRLSDFQELDVELETLGVSRGVITPRLPLELRSFIEAHSPDIVHTQGVRPDVLSAYTLPNQNRIATLRNYPYYDYTKAFGPVRGRLIAVIHLRALHRIDCPVACSETIQSLGSNHGIAFDVIRNGVDTQVYKPPSEDRKAERREELDLPSTSPVFVSVGALSERKDPETVVRGFLSSEFSDDAYLIFVGEGERQTACESIVSGRENVRFEGYVGNVVPYLQASDYFVSASTAEGLPNTVMEAMACGLPACLSDIGPHEEILGLQNDRAGVLFKTGSVEALSSALGRLTTWNREALSVEARALIESHLSAAETAKQYQNAYRKLAPP